MADLRYIRVERDAEIAVVFVDRQDKLNALNAEVVAELGRAFEELREDEGVRGVIVTGAGEKAFVAGADIDELAQMDSISGVGVSRHGQDVFLAIERFPKPVLAAVGGYALGGGCELALACHLRIASENARFGQPEVGLGIIPGYGGTIRLSRLVGLGEPLNSRLPGRWLARNARCRLGSCLPSCPASRCSAMRRTSCVGSPRTPPSPCVWRWSRSMEGSTTRRQRRSPSSPPSSVFSPRLKT